MRVALICILSTIGLMSFGQVESIDLPEKHIVGTARMGGQLGAELSYQLNNSDTTYTLLFRNDTYEMLTDFQTVEFTGGVNNLYSMLKQTFKTKKDQGLVIGKEVAILSYYTTIGLKGVSLRVSNGYVVLRDKDIDSLFGK